MSCEVDHLVVAAATLEQGAAWCEEVLGVPPGPGGRHELMGTHNRLLRVTADPLYPSAFLEIIAIDPQAPPPARARWFGLDDPALQRSLAERPRLLHWAARTRMIEMQRWGLVASGLQPGEPVAVSRDTSRGRLNWRLLVRDDGQLLHDGALPTLIQWNDAHPVDAMPASPVRLVSLAVRGVPAQAAAVLKVRGVTMAPESGPPAIEAVLDTPRGRVVLSSE